MRFGILLLGFLLLFGCVPPSQDQLRMEKDLAQMKRRLAQLEVKQADAVSTEVASGDNQQRQVAELVAGLDTLRVDFQSINGRLDDMEQENRQLAEDLQLSKDDLGLRLADVATRVEQLEQTSGKLAEEIKAIPAAPAPVAPTQQPAAVAETPEQLYQRALDLIRNQQQYAQGRTLLEGFISKYPQHDLYVNALYWSGEALYGEQQYERAILQLQDVISKYPKHAKAPAAMLKQALAFKALGDLQNARTTMQKLVADYPDAAQAEAAQKYLAQ